jgi:NADPH-dependent 2,4-dienoyl-CoA reductase/sulfur reductase-like enzyme/rhodanese-related sulfurtransferase
MNIVIVGGVAGGMSAATRARRMNEHASITVIEKGGFISFANCGLPYYLGGTITDESKLLITTPDAVRSRFRIDVRVRHEVTRIDRSKRTVEVLDHDSGKSSTLPYDKLILATGAIPIIPPIDNVRAKNVFVLRSVEDTQAIWNHLTILKPTRIAIIGGGFIGLEMAEQMKHRGLDVTLVEKNAHVLPPLDSEMAEMLDEELVRKGVKVFTGNGLKALEGAPDRVNAVILDDGTRVETDLVVMSIGVRPNVGLAKEAGIDLGNSGAVRVDAHGRTNDPAIYAVGDMTEIVHGVTKQPVRIPLAGPANRHGRLAGEHAATGESARFPAAMGTAIVKVFDLAAGITGLSEKAARAEGFEIDTAYVIVNNHVGYYPGATPVHLKLVYEKASGRVLGAQALGKDGVDKRLDVIATTLHFGGTVHDLTELDLAYSPQYGAAKDPVHMAGFVATNQQRGIGPSVRATDLTGELKLDVRSPGEFASGSIPGAINIPLDDLRERLADVDPDREIVTFCKVGQRGYVAQRILQQRGYSKVRNLKGGLTIAARQTP